MVSKGVSVIIVCILMATMFTTICQATYAESIDTIIPTQKDINYQSQFDEEFDVSVSESPYDGNGNLESLYVSPDGWFTLTFSDIVMHYTDVYDSNCNFLYQLSIKESGAVLSALDLTDHNLLLYPIRHHIVVKVNEQGQYLCAAETADASEAIDKLSALHPFDIVNNKKRYYFSGKNVLQSNSQEFIVFDLNGNVLFKYIPTNGDPNGFLNHFWKLGLCGICIIWITIKRARKTEDGLREPE